MYTASERQKDPARVEQGRRGMEARWAQARADAEEAAANKARANRLERINQRLIDTMVREGIDQSVILNILRENV